LALRPEALSSVLLLPAFSVDLIAARRAGRRSAALFASASGKGRRALCLLVLRRARLRRLLPGLRRLFCRRSLLSSLDSLGDSLGGLESWYYGQILRDEALAPPEYGKVLTSAVSLDEVRQTLQSYSYSVCYAVTAEPGTQGKGGSEDVE